MWLEAGFPGHPESAPHSSQHPTSLQPSPWVGHPRSVTSGSRLEPPQDGGSITPPNPAPVNKQLSAPTPPGQEAFLTAHLPDQFHPRAGAATCHGRLPAGPWDLTQASQHPSLSPGSLRAWPWAPGWVSPRPGCYAELHNLPTASV